MQRYTQQQVDISYEEFRQLRLDGKCNLGIQDEIAHQISTRKDLVPKGSSTRGAYAFWITVAFGIFVYSIYLSFTWAWWSFIIGLVIMGFIGSVNKRSNSENVLDDAFNNKDFYEKLRGMNCLVYQLDPKVAESYFVSKN